MHRFTLSIQDNNAFLLSLDSYNKKVTQEQIRYNAYNNRSVFSVVINGVEIELLYDNIFISLRFIILQNMEMLNYN